VRARSCRCVLELVRLLPFSTSALYSPAMAAELNPDEPPGCSVEAEPDLQGAANLASRWTRLGAAIIDVVVGMAIIGPVQYATGFYDNFPKIRHPTPLETLAWTVGGFAVWMLLHGYLVATRGQTLGKRLLNIQIVTVTDGRPASLARVLFGRFLPTVLVGHIPHVGRVLNLMNVLFIFRKDRRCIHDLIAGTRVINYRPKEWIP
jgi:uncharacterized RDD family membrane protein YckC